VFDGPPVPQQNVLIGQAFELDATLVFSGPGLYSWVGDLGSGFFSIDPVTGILSGLATQAEDVTGRVVLTDGANSAQTNLFRMVTIG
jgi:hypothetical protein